MGKKENVNIYSFKVDSEFDSKIVDVLESIPKGSKSSFIKDCIYYYIEQCEAGLVRSRYIKPIDLEQGFIVSKNQQIVSPVVVEEKANVYSNETSVTIDEETYEEIDEYEYEDEYKDTDKLLGANSNII